jgi:hypothetical protein
VVQLEVMLEGLQAALASGRPLLLHLDMGPPLLVGPPPASSPPQLVQLPFSALPQQPSMRIHSLASAVANAPPVESHAAAPEETYSGAGSQLAAVKSSLLSQGADAPAPASLLGSAPTHAAGGTPAVLLQQAQDSWSGAQQTGHSPATYATSMASAPDVTGSAPALTDDACDTLPHTFPDGSPLPTTALSPAAAHSLPNMASGPAPSPGLSLGHALQQLREEIQRAQGVQAAQMQQSPLPLTGGSQPHMQQSPLPLSVSAAAHMQHSPLPSIPYSANDMLQMQEKLGSSAGLSMGTIALLSGGGGASSGVARALALLTPGPLATLGRAAGYTEMSVGVPAATAPTSSLGAGVGLPWATTSASAGMEDGGSPNTCRAIVLSPRSRAQQQQQQQQQLYPCTSDAVPGLTDGIGMRAWESEAGMRRLVVVHEATRQLLNSPPPVATAGTSRSQDEAINVVLSHEQPAQHAQQWQQQPKMGVDHYGLAPQHVSFPTQAADEQLQSAVTACGAAAAAEAGMVLQVPQHSTARLVLPSPSAVPLTPGLGGSHFSTPLGAGLPLGGAREGVMDRCEV